MAYDAHRVLNRMAGKLIIKFLKWFGVFSDILLQKPEQLEAKNFSVRSFPLEARNLVTMSTTSDPDQYRLPTNVKPTHYDITIKTDLENLTFDGIVKVRYALSAIPDHSSSDTPSFDVKVETSTIVLNTLGTWKACVSSK